MRETFHFLLSTRPSSYFSHFLDRRIFTVDHQQRLLIFRRQNSKQSIGKIRGYETGLNRGFVTVTRRLLFDSLLSSSVRSETVNSGRRFELLTIFKHVLVAIRVNQPSKEPRPSKLPSCVYAFKTSCAASSTKLRCLKNLLATLNTRGLKRCTISANADSSPSCA